MVRNWGEQAWRALLLIEAQPDRGLNPMSQACDPLIVQHGAGQSVNIKGKPLKMKGPDWAGHIPTGSVMGLAPEMPPSACTYGSSHHTWQPLQARTFALLAWSWEDTQGGL